MEEDIRVNKLLETLETTEQKFLKLEQEVKQNVTQVKLEIKKKQGQEKKEFGHDHNGLFKGIEIMELNLLSQEVEKLESSRQSFATKISNLHEKQLLLQKHERKYIFEK